MQSAKKIGVDNLYPILGAAPEALAGLPPSDVILIGGSGDKLDSILNSCDDLLKPGGRLIITAVTVETLYYALQTMPSKQNYQVEAFGIQATRIKAIGSGDPTAILWTPSTCSII